MSEVSRQCRGSVEAVSIDTGVDGVEVCGPVSTRVRGRHIVALLAAWSYSTMAQTGVSGPVVVDGESFLDALFASAGQV